ncbi:MAG: ABC transporter ATP-binding protein [Candidatus Woesearchaeota archaeon]
MKPLIEFRDINLNFNGKKILNEVNLSVDENEILGLVGRSGTGKTTLFRLFLGIYKPSSGTIFFNGKKINKKIKHHVGFASQDGSFYPRLTVEENLAYFGRIYKLSEKVIKVRTKQLLELMQLQYAGNTKAENLSGGMKRRLDLALAMIHDPKVLVLDEPTTGLDIILNENIWDLILAIHKSGKTIIVSSHNLVEIEKYCTNVALVSHGKIVPSGELKGIKLEKWFRSFTNDASI